MANFWDCYVRSLKRERERKREETLLDRSGRLPRLTFAELREKLNRDSRSRLTTDRRDYKFSSLPLSTMCARMTEFIRRYYRARYRAGSLGKKFCEYRSFDEEVFRSAFTKYASTLL